MVEECRKYQRLIRELRDMDVALKELPKVLDSKFIYGKKAEATDIKEELKPQYINEINKMREVVDEMIAKYPKSELEECSKLREVKDAIEEKLKSYEAEGKKKKKTMEAIYDGHFEAKTTE